MDWLRTEGNFESSLTEARAFLAISPRYAPAVKTYATMASTGGAATVSRLHLPCSGF